MKIKFKDETFNVDSDKLEFIVRAEVDLKKFETANYDYKMLKEKVLDRVAYNVATKIIEIKGDDILAGVNIESIIKRVQLKVVGELAPERRY